MLSDRQIDDEEEWSEMCCGCIFPRGDKYDEVVSE